MKVPNIDHYTKIPGIECKDVVSHFSYNIGTAMAYLWRADYKHTSSIADYEKAMHHIQFEIDFLKKGVMKEEEESKTIWEEIIADPDEDPDIAAWRDVVKANKDREVKEDKSILDKAKDSAKQRL
jgi:hypothetical protein